MPLSALVLLLLAAVFHTGWNLLLRQVGDKYIVAWWLVLVGAICLTPMLLLGQPLPTTILPFSILSAIAEAAYFMLLATAYTNGDFSLVYPIARGAAPALIALWSFFFLHERVSFAGFLGLVGIVGGLMLVGSSAFWGRPAGIVVQKRSGIMAIGVALCISIYSVIDGAAMKLAPQPEVYMALTYWLTIGLLTPFILRRYGWWNVIQGWGKQRTRIFIAGILSVLAYVMVLNAYSLASVSYAGAIREMSIILAVLIGWLWLNETGGKMRLAGAGLVFAGIMLVAVAG